MEGTFSAGGGGGPGPCSGLSPLSALRLLDQTRARAHTCSLLPHTCTHMFAETGIPIQVHARTQADTLPLRPPCHKPSQ